MHYNTLMHQNVMGSSLAHATRFHQVSKSGQMFCCLMFVCFCFFLIILLKNRHRSKPTDPDPKQDLFDGGKNAPPVLKPFIPVNVNQSNIHKPIDDTQYMRP